MHESRHPPVGPVTAGHYRVRHGFRTRRVRGTRDYQLMLTVSGRARVGAVGGDIVADAGTVLLFSPGTQHDYEPASRSETWEYHWVHFVPHPHWTELLRLPVVAPGLARITAPSTRARRRAEALFHRLEALRADVGHYEIKAMHGLEAILIECADWAPPVVRWDPLIRKAVAYMLSHAEDAGSVSDVARVVGMSASRFAHRFTEEVGVSPHRFLEKERIARVRQQLERTTRSVKEIASDLGFSSAFYLSARFKHHTGHSPRAYRTLFAQGKLRFDAPLRLRQDGVTR